MSYTNEDFAYSYLQAGFLVIPLYWFDESKRRCACGKPTCSSPGKHPIGQLVPHGLTDATRSDSVVARWWKMYPSANVGVVTGSDSGLVVVDVDPRLAFLGDLRLITL